MIFFFYFLRALKFLYTHSVAALSLLHEVGSMLLQDCLAQSVKKFLPLMESERLREHTKELFFFYFTCKGKSVPLQARGAQRVPGSYGSQIT